MVGEKNRLDCLDFQGVFEGRFEQILFVIFLVQLAIDEISWTEQPSKKAGKLEVQARDRCLNVLVISQFQALTRPQAGV